METIQIILTALSHTLSAAQTGYTVYNWLVAYIRKRGHEQKADDIKRWLNDLGTLSEAAIRTIVSDWAKRNRSVTSEEADELMGLLINLARGARFLTTEGLPRSSYVRCEKLVEQLLTDIRPVRLRGEPVAPGHDWRLEQYLGRGSFGEVWMAKSAAGYPTPRAYKFFTNDDAKEWVRQEGTNLAAVLRALGDHPNIIKFIDLSIDRQRWPFLVLEYAAGGSLEDWIVEDPSKRVKLDKHEVIRGIVLGLAKAHEQHIFHRDLKPANILLTNGPDVRAKIADFGLAKIAGANQANSSAQISDVGQVGTAMYLPPEAQEVFLQRQPAQDDVFAIGVLWYQLMVERLERPPYNFAERLLEHQLGSHTIRLIARCLADPHRRFTNACALAEEMEDVAPPDWTAPSGCYDVQHLVREYIGSSSR